MQPVIVILVLVAILLFNAIKIINEYERGVVFRLGRLIEPKMPGVNFLIPMIDRMRKVDMRTITMDVPSQDVITKDNVSVKVNAVVYFRVLDVNRAIVEVENYLYATSQLAQTTLRSVCGEASLDDLLVSREALNARLQDILDHSTDPWGIKVSMVEIKHIDLPLDMQRAMAKEAEAERERRAKIIAAEGEFQAAEKLSQAALVIAKAPQALQLRYLQTIKEITREGNTTTIFPLPIDLITSFIKRD